MPAELTKKFSGLNPFKKIGKGEDEEDAGEQIQVDVKGHRVTHDTHVVAKEDLRVSHALKSFLSERQILSEADSGVENDDVPPALRQLLGKPHIFVPPELTERGHPLPEYYVSSSHNTYLLAHQLYGESCASGYETALRTGSRCVEIDAWDDSDNPLEPKVTHGFTLTSHISFRDVCQTIRRVFEEEYEEAAKTPGHTPAPVLLSLENHCGAVGQQRLVDIMKEEFGPWLLSEAVREEGHREQEGSGEHVTLAELGAKIAVIVEYHFAGEPESSDTDSSDEGDAEDEREARKEYKEQKKKEGASIIIPELAKLGVYAQSVKPVDKSWYDPGILTDGPHHHLINVSESGLKSHLPKHTAAIAKHNSEHLMRVFPKGTRIGSSNLKPVPFWGLGAQICALNWQHFGTSNQLNDALFATTDGYVLKPKALRAGGDGNLGTGRKKILRLHVAGATNVPLHDESEADSIRPYLTCTLYHPDDLSEDTPKRKTNSYRQHRLGFLHKGENPPPIDPIWDDILEWEYWDTEMSFVRLLLKSDENWTKNPMFATVAIRLQYVGEEWTFVRLLDMKGQETNCTVLVRFEFRDA
ncbi:hypothetical protein N3K66_000241 [Trichothecium roseum]|uniref:Uncharacterized protein n=1 Tax=Trichothecium roseum TaxID=47278 RepID=A0ACC0VCV0_9HYPO|nr:hypothetical protein N3K66_000241 [Trichothecium roseum]